MKPKSLIVLLLLVSLTALPGWSQSKKDLKKERSLLGEALDFGRKAAEFGLWNEAIFHWEQVVKADPNNAKAANNLAVAYESIGAYEKAEAQYRKALDLDEDSAEIRKNMKRFRSFYRKHKKQLAREQRIKSKDGEDSGVIQPVEDEEGEDEDDDSEGGKR